MKRLLLALCLICLVPPALADNAQQLFGELQDRIFQIRLIEQNSASKSAIGSGFQVSADGLIATNFHVVAGAVHRPEKYQLEYIDHRGNKGRLTLVDIDVVNDLALVRREAGGPGFIPLSTRPLVKGEQVFSIGNPHDLGMLVVSGTYNGPVEHTYHGRLLFSGSLNPGMSGGPALNASGQIIGVNVATSGEQLSFLVPVEKLVALLSRADRPSPTGLRAQIQPQLLTSQQEMVDAMLSNRWPGTKLGGAEVAGEVASFIRCWGESNSDAREARFHMVTSSCGMDESVFIDDNLDTGTVSYSFTWLESRDLNPFQLYARLEREFGFPDVTPMGDKNHVERFHCYSDFVKPGDGVYKTVLCTRHYKDYPGLYDVLGVTASVNDTSRALLGQFALTGVSREQGFAFARRFLESVKWTSSSK